MLSPAAAEDLRFSGMDRRIAATSPQRSAFAPVRQMEYTSDVDAQVELMPDGAVPMDESTIEGNGHGGCSCDDCGSGGSCGCGDCGSCGCGDCAGCDDGCCQQGCCCGQDACCCGQDNCCYSDCGGYCPTGRGMFYGEAQLMFLRAHASEEVLGKLSESHEFSPRIIFGYETCTGLGVRTRYWMYDDDVDVIDNPGTQLGLDWNVFDVEGTARFRTDRADLVVGAGFRWTDASVEINQLSVSSTMPGITLAADARAWICQSCVSQWSGICGARWSILGGDWEGETPIGDGVTIDLESRDDNVVVQEIYAGFEYLRYFNSHSLFARLVFEAQNWRSDFLNTEIDAESIGFLGPGIHVGGTY
jgi:hypothetical protein